VGIDFEAQRITMVDNQIRPSGVTSLDVLSAFLTIPRQEFVPAHFRQLAYIDSDIKVADTPEGPRYIMEPSPLARLVQLAAIKPDDVILEVGAATGYSAAIMGRLGGLIVALESDEELAMATSERLSQLGADNIAVVTGPLKAGYPSEAPFDLIFFSGSLGFLPDTFLGQLRDGGRLVAVEGEGPSARAYYYLKHGDHVSRRAEFNVSVPPLPGFEETAVFEF